MVERLTLGVPRIEFKTLFAGIFHLLYYPGVKWFLQS